MFGDLTQSEEEIRANSLIADSKGDLNTLLKLISGGNSDFTITIELMNKALDILVTASPSMKEFYKRKSELSDNDAMKMAKEPTLSMQFYNILKPFVKCALSAVPTAHNADNLEFLTKLLSLLHRVIDNFNDQSIFMLIAQRMNKVDLPIDALEKILNNIVRKCKYEYSNVLLEIAKHPNVTPRVLESVFYVGGNDPIVAYAIAKNPNISIEVLNAILSFAISLAHDNDYKNLILSEVIKHRNITAKVLESAFYVSGNDPIVAYAIAKNPNISIEVLNAILSFAISLAHDNEHKILILSEVIKHRNVTAKVLESAFYVSGNDPILSYAIAKNPNISIEVLNAILSFAISLAHDNEHKNLILSEVIKHRNVTDELLKLIIEDIANVDGNRDIDTLLEIAKSPKITKEIVSLLLKKVKNNRHKHDLFMKLIDNPNIKQSELTVLIDEIDEIDEPQQLVYRIPKYRTSQLKYNDYNTLLQIANSVGLLIGNTPIERILKHKLCNYEVLLGLTQKSSLLHVGSRINPEWNTISYYMQLIEPIYKRNLSVLATVSEENKLTLDLRERQYQRQIAELIKAAREQLKCVHLIFSIKQPIPQDLIQSIEEYCPTPSPTPRPLV